MLIIFKWLILSYVGIVTVEDEAPTMHYRTVQQYYSIILLTVVRALKLTAV